MLPYGPVSVNFPTSLRAVVFDVDGTLYNQRRLRRKMTAHLLSQFAGRPLQGLLAIRVLRAHRKALERLRLEEQPSDIAAGQVEFCCSRTGVDEATARHIVTELFDQAPIRFLSECRQPGLEEFLVEARKAGVCLGIVSDYPASTKLRALNLEGFFDVVVDASSPSRWSNLHWRSFRCGCSLCTTRWCPPSCNRFKTPQQSVQLSV